jgi:hypothetical protein
MGSLEYQDLYERDVFLTRDSLDFTRDHFTLQIKPIWNDTHHFIVTDNSESSFSNFTSFGADFVRSQDIHVSHVYSPTDQLTLHGNIHMERSFVNSGLTYTQMDDQELVSKRQMNEYLLNYLTANVEFNDTTIVALIEDALLNITLPDVQTERIEQVLNEYRSNTMEDDVTNVLYTLTVDQDRSALITSNVLDHILEDYVTQMYIPNLSILNREVSQLFDFPMGYFYLRLEDYVSNYVNNNVPSLVNMSNIVYLDFLLENYYTKDEINEGGFGSGTGSGNISSNIDLGHLLTKIEANNTYVKKSDFMTDDGNIHFDYIVESDINVYKYTVNDIKTFVHAVQPQSANYVYTVQSDPHTIRVTGLDTGNVSSPTIDFNVLRTSDRVLLLYPMTNSDTNQLDSRYNGIFRVDEIVNSTTVMLSRAIDFKTVSSIVNALIYVQGRSSLSAANGNSYLVTFPKNTQDVFAINSDEIVMIPFIVQDNTHGSMAYQDHTNVNITGGTIAASHVYTSSIVALDSSFTVHIPAAQYFQITSVVPGESQQDPIFSVDEQGHVSAFQFAHMSDRQLKTNIQPIERPLELISAMEGKTFDWKDESKNKKGSSYGFIAQEIQQVIPSAVSNTFAGHLTVDYTKVIPILTEAVKELYQLVKARTEKPQEMAEIPRSTERTPDLAEIPRSTEKTPDLSEMPRYTERTPYFTETTRATECQRTINVIPRPVETRVTTNVYSIGSTSMYTVNLASTDLDDVTMEPLFISVENRQIYSIFTNLGQNTLDNVPIEIDDVVLIKNSKDPRYNGVFKISGIQHVSFGRFSKCYRMDDFKTYEEMQHTTVMVSPSGFAGNGKGEQNVGISYTCILNVVNETSFRLDTTEISFISFGLNPQLGTMSMQNHNDVNITGGKITTNQFTTSNLFPYDNTSTISMNLKGSTIYDTFQVKNELLDTIFSVDGTGKASAFEYYAPSDSKLKKNIQKIDNAFELLQNLNGVTFDWKKKSQNNGTNYGFIAQEVAAHFPSLVHKRSDGYLAVDYSKVVSILVESVKDIGNMLKTTL